MCIRDRPSGDRVAARKTGNFFGLRVRIGQHQHQVIHRLGIHRDVCRIAVAFGCIVEYHGILAIVMHEVACIFHILVGVVIKLSLIHI